MASGSGGGGIAAEPGPGAGAGGVSAPDLAGGGGVDTGEEAQDGAGEEGAGVGYHSGDDGGGDDEEDEEELVGADPLGPGDGAVSYGAGGFGSGAGMSVAQAARLGLQIALDLYSDHLAPDKLQFLAGQGQAQNAATRGWRWAVGARGGSRQLWL